MSNLKVATLAANETISNNITVQSPSHIASPGAPIQTLYYRTDERSSWAAPIGTPELATRVLPLGLTITPKKANSLIVMEWMVNGEFHHNAQWVIFLNNSVVSTPGYWGYNGAPAISGRWVGYVPGRFDGANNNSSTPDTYFIQYSIIPNSTSTMTFYPAVKSSDGVAQTFFLNRTLSSLGADNFENAISTGIIMEIAQ